MGRFVVAKQTVKQTAQLFCPSTRKTLREDNSDAPETAHETLPVFDKNHVSLIKTSTWNYTRCAVAYFCVFPWIFDRHGRIQVFVSGTKFCVSR